MTYKEAMLLAEKHQREVVDPAIEELKKIIRKVINKKEDRSK